LITRTDITLPKIINSNTDWGYACLTNKEQNTISAGVFHEHIIKTHPSFQSNKIPPDHTIVIEGDFHTTTKKNSSRLNVTNTLLHHILTTCGDDNIKYGSHKHADSALCLYTSINLICVMSNENMEQKPTCGNGTVCKLISVKIREGADTYKWKNLYNKKVWRVNAKDAEWLTVDLAESPGEITLIQTQIDLIQKQGDTLTNSQSSNHRNLERLPETKKKDKDLKYLQKLRK